MVVSKGHLWVDNSAETKVALLDESWVGLMVASTVERTVLLLVDSMVGPKVVK